MCDLEKGKIAARKFASSESSAWLNHLMSWTPMTTMGTSLAILNVIVRVVAYYDICVLPRCRILTKRRKRLGLKKRFRILATIFVYVPSKKKLLRSSKKKVNQSVNLLRNIFSQSSPRNCLFWVKLRSGALRHAVTTENLPVLPQARGNFFL